MLLFVKDMIFYRELLAICRLCCSMNLEIQFKNILFYFPPRHCFCKTYQYPVWISTTAFNITWYQSREKISGIVHSYSFLPLRNEEKR